MGLLLALAAACGVYLLYTSVVFGWTGIAPGAVPAAGAPTRGTRVRHWIQQAGLGESKLQELAAAFAVLGAIGAGLAWSLFGGWLAPLAAGALAATIPLSAFRARRRHRRLEARESWPRLIEEIRIQATTLGRSVPQALLDVGRRGPEEMRPAFEAARREWLISTDFERALAVAQDHLADATADVVCETLLVAHQIGGNDVQRCLSALVEDRAMDLQGRKDAHARQAGAAFARRFVLLVPLGMALVGLSIGEGRAAYGSATSQLLVLAGMVLIAVCWVWAGRIMRLPEEQRVFGRPAAAREAQG